VICGHHGAPANELQANQTPSLQDSDPSLSAKLVEELLNWELRGDRLSDRPYRPSKLK
jgi:hypothetical protein